MGNISRLKPFIDQLGTTPSISMPDSHNAGDFGYFLVGAPHEYSLDKEELLKHKTDGHMDINRAREGAIEIGRYPGTATVTFLAPVELLEKVGLYSLIREQYNM